MTESHFSVIIFLIYLSNLFVKIGGDFTLKFAYARVSTRKQLRDGNGLGEQIAKLKAEGYDELVVEEFTGSTTNRPAFDSLIKRLSSGDSLIVTKLDRIARSTSQGSALISTLLNKGVAVHILNMGRIVNTPTGKLITNILLAFAEYERDKSVLLY